MNCFQLIDCNSGEVCEVGANAVAPSLREFLYPAVREGTGLYKGLFYRIACFDGRQGKSLELLRAADCALLSVAHLTCQQFPLLFSSAFCLEVLQPGCNRQNPSGNRGCPM